LAQDASLPPKAAIVRRTILPPRLGRFLTKLLILFLLFIIVANSVAVLGKDDTVLGKDVAAIPENLLQGSIQK
jgi:hypothetical protein